ncbi:hypothetical protein [Pseudarthrobacter albicanus]|uniref:hypothetical protein n=1 Tax=Pseudarthrobacter albicanus TaxID=2823873 RepID=UPI001BA9AB3D|nr:hypothetical protein [Pseudarthrobacter albicanus]
MGNSGKFAIGAMLAALALLVLTGITLHETVFMWFLAVCAAAYVACVAELLIRRRHKTLAATGLGSILFIAFGIAFLRQWGLAFNPDPDALSTRVDADHPDLYFYLAAVSGAATLLLLFAGTVLPGRGNGYASRRRPGSRPARRGPARRPASNSVSSRGSAPRGATTRASRTSAAGPSAPRNPAPASKRPSSATPSAAKPVAKSPAKPAAKSPTRTAARASGRR